MELIILCKSSQLFHAIKYNHIFIYSLYILITLTFNFFLSLLKSISLYWVGQPMLWHILNHQLILHFLWLGMMFQKIIITEDIFHFLNQRQPGLLWEQISHFHTNTHIHTYLLTHRHSYIIIYALTCEHGYVMNEANWNSLRLLEIHRKLREKEKEWNVWNVTNSLFSIWFGVAVFFKNFDKIPLPF